jgi:hypothetical protein
MNIYNIYYVSTEHWGIPFFVKGEEGHLQKVIHDLYIEAKWDQDGLIPEIEDNCGVLYFDGNHHSDIECGYNLTSFAFYHRTRLEDILDEFSEKEMEVYESLLEEKQACHVVEGVKYPIYLERDFNKKFQEKIDAAIKDSIQNNSSEIISLPVTVKDFAQMAQQGGNWFVDYAQEDPDENGAEQWDVWGWTSHNQKKWTVMLRCCE